MNLLKPTLLIAALGVLPTLPRPQRLAPVSPWTSETWQSDIVTDIATAIIGITAGPIGRMPMPIAAGIMTIIAT
jgi:hypothetical protein